MLGSVDNLALEAGSKSLDALWLRANVISNNIANNDTPGYTQQTVSFEDQLSSALSDNRLTDEELASVQPSVEAAPGGGTPDGSAVDIDSQIVELMRSQLQYNYLERAVSGNLGLLETAASEGRK